jgi:hypothetical protein
MAREELLEPSQLALVRKIVEQVYEEVGRKQSNVVEKTGIKQQQVSAIMNGKQVGFGVALKLAERGYLNWTAFMGDPAGVLDQALGALVRETPARAAEFIQARESVQAFHQPERLTLEIAKEHLRMLAEDVGAGRKPPGGRKK